MKRYGLGSGRMIDGAVCPLHTRQLEAWRIGGKR